jgi:hypothetical protein
MTDEPKSTSQVTPRGDKSCSHGYTKRSACWECVNEDLDKAEADLEAVYDAFGIGSAARNRAVLLENVKNATRRSACLSAVEREVFTRIVQDEEGEEGEDCALNWGSAPAQYVEQFRAALEARGPSDGEPRQPDPDCICQGNWRAIVNESRPLLGRRFRDGRGKEWTFFGLVDGNDDYYYGMWDQERRELALLSCVGSLDGHGFEPVADIPG